MTHNDQYRICFVWRDGDAHDVEIVDYYGRTGIVRRERIRSITADTALRLTRYFGMTPEFWMNLQAAYELEVATRASAQRIARDVRPREAA